MCLGEKREIEKCLSNCTEGYQLFCFLNVSVERVNTTLLVAQKISEHYSLSTFGRQCPNVLLILQNDNISCFSNIM